ncbi:MAG TPA: hypothetical protein VFA12_15310 [Stellaceae bacterium]|nr:hypothetical protein [Stellaceae bacterium]
MSKLFSASLAAAIVGFAVVAQAQGAFDGTYAGVSVVSSSGPRCPAPGSNVPAALVIANGTARSGQWTGSINPQGAFSMKHPNGCNMGGQVQPGGRAVANSFCTQCGYSFVWQKR